MSTEILNSLLSERGRGSRAIALSRTGTISDQLELQPTKTVKYQTVFDTAVVDETIRAQAGSIFTTRVGTYAGWIQDSYAVVTLNAPAAAAALADNVGLNIINRLTVRHSDNVSEIAYRATMAHLMAMMKPEDARAVAEFAGGKSSASDKTVVVPLPVFWSKIAQGGMNVSNMGLPTFLLNSPIEIEFQLAPVADLLAPGAAFTGLPWSSFRIVHVLRRATAATLTAFRNQPWSMTGAYDYQTLQNLPIANSATTTVDVTAFDGSSTGLALNFRDTTLEDLAPAVTDKYRASIIQTLEMGINGALYAQLGTNIASSNTAGFVQLMSRISGAYPGGNEWNLNAAAVTDRLAPMSARLVFIPFASDLQPPGVRDHGTTPEFRGALDMKSVTKVTVSVGTTLAPVLPEVLLMDVTNVRQVDYTIIAGDLRRVK